MCFSDTIDEVRAGRQKITFRPGWDKLKPGMVLIATENSIFPEFKEGEKIKPIRNIVIVNVKTLAVHSIDEKDLLLASPKQTEINLKTFIANICDKYHIKLWNKIKRIEFDYFSEGNRGH
jgi:hypothetical protein